MFRFVASMIAMAIGLGCGAATGLEVDDDAGAVDAGSASRRDAGPRPPIAAGIAFRLSFRSKFGESESIFAQASSSSREGPAFLTLSTADGEPLAFVERCDLCSCEACTGCPRCGPPIDHTARLHGGGGEAIEFFWPGLLYPTGVCDRVTRCTDPAVPAPPGRYVATFCWSYEATGKGEGHTVGTTVCDQVPFTVPDADGLVEDPVCACG